MPPRLNKRQQRELEELEALNHAKPSEAPQGSDDEDAPETSPIRSKSAFMNLLAPEESDDEEEEEEKTTKSRKSKKKKKKAAAATPAPAADVAPPTPSKSTRTSTPAPPARNEKKAQKKARAKEKKAANDELDQVLAELSIQYPPSERISQAGTGKQSLADLLSISLQYLDGEAELKRFFGSRVVQATRDEGQSSSSKKKAPLVKSNLTRPQRSWSSAKGREGLSIRQLTDEETTSKLSRQGWTSVQEKWWTVEYSKKYLTITKAFMQTVLSGDPNGFWDLLGTLPWHADTLLQLSEVYRHRDEHVQAVDFIDRALFTYERAFIGAFAFTTGLNRLDFDLVENRPFFLALHRQVSDLQRRGCVRTSFEFARLMYSLDPWNDPHGVAFHLDFLAIKAGMHQWLLDIFEVFTERYTKNQSKPDSRLNPSLLPGWAYARALALKVSEDAGKDKEHIASTQALKQAARDFPSVVPLLADKLDVSLTSDIRSHRDFRILTDSMSLSPAVGILHLLSHLYVQRSAPVWKDHADWFASTIIEEFRNIPSSLPATDKHKAFLAQYENTSLQYSVYRHIMVLETSYRRLFSFIPRKVLEAKSLACDPLPPLTSVNQYDQQFFASVEDTFSSRLRTRRQREVDERRLAQLIPDAAFRQQLQGFFDGNPRFAARFPGGLLHFAQVAGQLPPDVLEDLMLVEAVNAPPAAGAGAPAAEGGMPGGFAEFGINEQGFAEVNVVPGQQQQQQQGAGAVEGGPLPGLLEAFRVRDGRGEVEQEQEAEGFDTEGEEEEDEEEEDVSPMPRVIRNLLGRFWGRAQPEESSSEDDDDDGGPIDDTGVD